MRIYYCKNGALLAISETRVGFSLAINRWKAVLEKNMNMEKYFNNNLLSVNPKRIKICTLSQGTGYGKISRQILLKRGNSKTEKKFQIISFLKKVIVVFNEFIQIHSNSLIVFSQKVPFFSPVNSLFKHINMRMVILFSEFIIS